MSDKIKFTPEELKSVADLQQKYTQATFRLGQVQLEKFDLTDHLNALEVEVENLRAIVGGAREDEKKLLETLQAKYGQGQLDLNTGEFTPATAPQPK